MCVCVCVCVCVFEYTQMAPEYPQYGEFYDKSYSVAGAAGKSYSFELRMLTYANVC